MHVSALQEWKSQSLAPLLPSLTNGQRWAAGEEAGRADFWLKSQDRTYGEGRAADLAPPAPPFADVATEAASCKPVRIGLTDPLLQHAMRSAIDPRTAERVALRHSGVEVRIRYRNLIQSDVSPSTISSPAAGKHFPTRMPVALYPKLYYAAAPRAVDGTDAACPLTLSAAKARLVKATYLANITLTL
ncbi:hypothetical protein G7046_g7902 [Stylonectria norvegica]|nr:hypothetical protein G7046_g7902 [Stylonectria norvegica]